MKVFHEVKQTSIKKLIIPLEYVKFGKLATVTEQLQCCVLCTVCTTYHATESVACVIFVELFNLGSASFSNQSITS